MIKRMTLSVIAVIGLVCLFLWSRGYLTSYYKIPQLNSSSVQPILEKELQMQDSKKIIPSVQKITNIPKQNMTVVVYKPQKSYSNSAIGIVIFEKKLGKLYKFAGSELSNYPITAMNYKFAGDTYLALLLDNTEKDVRSFRVTYSGVSKTYYPKQEFFVGILKGRTNSNSIEPTYRFFDEDHKDITEKINSSFPSNSTTSFGS